MNRFSFLNHTWMALKPILKYLCVVAFFWLAFFEVFRIIFLFINWSKSIEVPLPDLLLSFVYGLRFDASITGYILMLFAVVLALGSFLIPLRTLLRTLNILNAVLVVLMVGFLLTNGFVYSFWGVIVADLREESN